MQTEAELVYVAKEQVHANVVLAALALMTGTAPHGVVRADQPFRVLDANVVRAALLEFATAVQTEVSLSIYSSDALLLEAAHDLRQAIGEAPEFCNPESAVIAIDEVIQDWLTLLTGRRQDLIAISERIEAAGEVSLAEMARILHLEQA